MCLSNDRCARWSLKGDPAACSSNNCAYDDATDLCFTDCAKLSKAQCTTDQTDANVYVDGVACRWDDKIDKCYAVGSYCGVRDNNTMKCMRPDEQLMHATLTNNPDNPDPEVEVETVTSADFAYFAHLQTDDDGGVSSWQFPNASDYSLNLCRVDADCSSKRGIQPYCSTNCSIIGSDCGGLFEANEAECDCGTGLKRGNSVCLPASAMDYDIHSVLVRPCTRFGTQTKCEDAYGYLGHKCTWNKDTSKCV